MKDFKRLLEPGYIGPIRTRNRIIKPGAAMLYWHEHETTLNKRVRYFYEALAKGGVGLIIVESPVIDYPLGARWRRRYRIDDDKYIDGLRELTELIHSYGCPTFMQMNHDGPWQTKPWGDVDPLVKERPIASSPIAVSSENDFHNEVPRELTKEEIENLIGKFADAAERAKRAGFDGVDINAGSSHLLHNFLSPFWNRRKDEYGGSLENRTRFLVGIIKEIKRRLGSEFPVTVTINGFETGRLLGIKDEDCLKHEESIKIARILEEAGANAIQIRTQWIGYHVAGFFPEALFYPELPFSPKDFPYPYDFKRNGKGAHIPTAFEIKKHLTIPVIAVGRITPEIGERILREKKADFIALNRALIADPELPNKLFAGNFEDIVPCTACHTCLEPLEIKRCRINGALGLDEPYELKKAEKRKKILIVGGGPSGMEAARVAAMRGHEVILYERSKRLGGSILLASFIKGSKIEDLKSIIEYFRTQLKKLSVKVRLGKTIDLLEIERENPDAVIIATGAEPSFPQIEGIERPHVLPVPDLYNKLRFYLRFAEPNILRVLARIYMPLRRRIAIIGGDKRACELAEFLTKMGRKIVIIDKDEDIGRGLFHHLKYALLSWFKKKGVEIIAGVKEIKIIDEGLFIIDKEGNERKIHVDHVIPFGEQKPKTDLYELLKGKVKELYLIGDSNNPGEIVDAISQGFEIGRKI